MADAQFLREEGNRHFKEGDIDSAVACYTQALDLGDMKDADKAIIYKNRAACHLKREKYSAAVQDASSCKCYSNLCLLIFSPTCLKAKFRKIFYLCKQILL